MHTNEGFIMGIYPKIGITGLPRSGKSAVLQKVIQMVREERKNNSRKRYKDIIGGIQTEAIVENGEKGIIAHKNIDSRHRILGYGIDPTELDRVAVPAILEALDECEVLVIDEVGKFSVESEAFVAAVRAALEYDKPTLMTLHKKSRHPLLQDIRRRDDGRVLEVTPVNRALLPYKIHKLLE
jgi:nucleoside-triphosphatase